MRTHHKPCPQVEQFLRWAGEDGFTVARVSPDRIPEEYRVPDDLVVTLQLAPGGREQTQEQRQEEGTSDGSGQGGEAAAAGGGA